MFHSYRSYSFTFGKFVLCKKVESEQKVTPNYKARLKSLYDDAIKVSSKEEKLLRKALSKIYEIKDITHEIRITSRNVCSKKTCGVKH